MRNLQVPLPRESVQEGLSCPKLVYPSLRYACWTVCTNRPGFRLAEGMTQRKSALAREEAADKVASLVLTYSMRLTRLLFKTWCVDIQKLGLFVCCSHLKKLDFWSAGDVESPHLVSPRPNEQRAGKVVYVDDLGLMLAAATPRVLMRKLPTALDCIGEQCERHRLRVHYQPGKTEIMLHLSGKDQGKLKAKTAADGNEIHTPGGLYVRVVNSYVHLGSTMGDDNADVERRHNACMQSYAPIAHSVFGNCCFRVKDRVSLARSLCSPVSCTTFT